MSAQAAARTADEIAHGFGLLAMVAGAVIGALVGAAIIAATVASGGAALAVVGAVVAAAGTTAGAGLGMGQIVKGLTTIFDLPEPTSGILAVGSINVFVNSRNALRAGIDMAVACSGIPINHILLPMPMVLIAEGSASVFVNGKPMVRLTCKLVCGAHVKSASHNTFVGGPTARVLAVADLEEWVHTGLEILGIAALLGGLVIACLTGVAAVAAFLAIGGAIFAGMKGLGYLGDRLGPGYSDLLQGIAGIVLVGLAPKGMKGLRGIGDEPFVTPGEEPVVPPEEPVVPPEEPPAPPQDPPGSYRDANGRLRSADGKFMRDPNAPPRGISRDTEYPSGYRQGTHDEMAARWTDEGRAQGGTPVDANGNKIPRDQLTWRDADGNEIPYYDENGNTNLTYDHDPPVVQHWNEGGGNNMPRSGRNDYYNDPDNLTPMGRSQNSSDGAGLGMTYDQNTGPDYNP